MTYQLRIFLTVILLGLGSCSLVVEVRVTNLSPENLTHLELRAGQVLATINQVESGLEKSVTFTPTSDSSLVFNFRTESGVAKTCAIDVYLTKGLHGEIDVAIKDDFSCELRQEMTSIR